jgi:superfamily II DNA or RNA helicase
MLIHDEQPQFTGAMSAYPYNYVLHKKFKFESKFGEAVDMAYKEGALLYVPREAVPMGEIDYRRSFPPVAINCSFEPRNEEQATLPDYSLNLLRKGISHVFNAPTGWGKSVAGGYIACALGQPTMVVVNKTDLMDSWYDAIVNVLGVPPSMVGKVQQDICDWQGKRIVIGMAQSLCIPDRYDAEMFRYFGLLIVDEVHQIPTEFFGNIFKLFPARYRLGFSATTDRKDGKWQIVEANIGKVLIHGKLVPMKPKILVKQSGWRIPRRKVYENGELIEVPIPYTPGRMTHVTKAMAGSRPRNMEIVNFAKAAYEAGRTVLILSDLIDDHLKLLFLLLTQNGIPGEHIGYYIGGMTKQQLEVTKGAKIVLATYKMVATGTNVPRWDSLCFATPHSDIRQALGRILRAMEGKKQPVALDLVDFDKIYQNFFSARLSQYYSVGAEIKRLS